MELDLRSGIRTFFARLPGLFRSAAARTNRMVRKHPRTAIVIVLLGFLCMGLVWRFSALTAHAAFAEERAYWAKARNLNLVKRTGIRNNMVRTGRVPHLLPWWEMDGDRCSAVAWKLVNLLSGIELSHGKNGSAWMLRKQNPGKLRTIWDGTDRFDAEGRLGGKLEPTLKEFRDRLDRLDPDRLYLAGFRWLNTASASKIKRDRADINSHVVVISKSILFHMFGYGVMNDPIVADLEERFFDSQEMQPVWLAEVSYPDGKPFKFARTKLELRLDQRVYPWKKLRFVLRVPDKVPGVNALERSILYWVRDGYDMYPRLP